MTTRPPKVHTQLGRSAIQIFAANDRLIQIFAANDRLNQIIIEHLDPAAWRARPPGKTRCIAAIFTHMHNVRSKWVRLTAPHLKVPAQLNRARCTPRQARAGLAQSAARCAEMLAEVLGDGGGRVKQFRRDGWAQPWPAGLEMLCYMLSHEAHHRGQVCMLAHQLGFPLSNQVTSGLWNWEKLWKECGAGPIGA
ncbi:MAG TPA: DinB family protein [Candidatus Angelobacter sp.]|nr:DinB family protein [Candidatus Angelobacter sp.]